MSLIFNDILQVSNTSGLYTLMGYANGTWHDLYTISGPTDGEIKVDEKDNPISVDTSIFIPGLSYMFKWVDSHGAESNVISVTLPVSYYYYGDRCIGSGNLSYIKFLGISDDNRGLCAVAYEALIADPNNQLWLLHIRAGESMFYEAVDVHTLSVGNVFIPNYDIEYLSYINGDTYQLCLIDTVANPSINLSDQSNILSNTLMAIDFEINSLTEDMGFDPTQGRLIIDFDANISEAGELHFNDTGNGGNYAMGIATPFTGSNVLYTTQVNYNPGFEVQLVLHDGSGNIIGSSVFKQMP